VQASIRLHNSIWRKRRGVPEDNIPGKRIVIPEHPSQIIAREVDLDHIRRSYLHHAIESLPGSESLDDIDLEFLAAETRTSQAWVQEVIDEIH
jgi:hypothetical protein